MSVGVDERTPAHYRQSPQEVLAQLASDPNDGLDETEAQRRLLQYGRNELTAQRALPAWRKFLAQFQNVLVTLLLIATVISFVLWLIERDSALPYDSIAIFAVVLLNAIMGFVQQERAAQAVAALRRMSAAT